MSLPSLEELTGININSDVLIVQHANLNRYGDSMYKSVCPVCEQGILFIRRDDEGHLMPDDMCCLCAQKVRYTDLETLEVY